MSTSSSMTWMVSDGDCDPLDWLVEEEVVAVAALSTSTEPKKKRGKKTKKSPAKKQLRSEAERTKPKRILNAYNFFFQYHRQAILASLPEREEGARPSTSHGKIDFATLAREISTRWKNATDQEKIYFQSLSLVDKERYKNEMEKWKQEEETRKGKEQGMSLGFDETRLLDKQRLENLALALGDDCGVFIRLFR